MSEVRTHGTSSVYSGGMSSEVFNSRVLPMFGLGLAMTGASAYIGWNLPSGFLIVAFIVELLMVLTASKWAYQERGSMNVGIYLFFTALSGITLVPLLKWGLNVGGASLLLQALGTTSVTFGGLAIYSSKSKKDFSFLGGFLTMALLGVILGSIINVFVGGTLLSLTLSIISVAIFSMFVLYDMSTIRNHYSNDAYIMATIALYLDFIGLLQNIIRILGIFSSNDD